MEAGSSHSIQVLADEAARHTRVDPRSDGAVEANEAVLALDPENVDSLLRLTRCRLERSEYRAALDVASQLHGLALAEDELALLERWRERATQGLERVERRGRRDDERRRRLEARRARIRSEAADVTAPDVALGLGRAYADRDHERAIAYLERGLELTKSRRQRMVLLTTLGPVLRADGRTAEALGVLEEAIALDPTYEGNRAAYTAYAATLRRVERLDEARRHGEALRAAFPTDPFILNALGAVYTDLVAQDGDPGLARQAQDCFLEAERHGAERLGSIRYLRKLIAEVRYAGAKAEAAGRPGAMSDAEQDVGVIERHIRRLEADAGS